ncbi:MAG TPA: glycerol-3-phosphate dehydrogenase/oxidase [Vicinamibacteria bacterium]|nr:glycerol-3-phosphate dehydrogenase/oxidase [Vicinamibacteria bacterium]
MKRDVAALSSREFDLVIVGAGVYGAAIAWDAVLRGLSVALIDRNDFGSETSFNSLKTVHGGIRYLQSADLKRIRESVRERRTLLAIAPHLVHPLPFLVPTYRGSFRRSRSMMRAALALNDLISWDRNEALGDPDKHLPPGRSVSRDECLALFPGLEPSGLTGGILWYDAQMYNSDRLTLSFVLSAANEGAVVANHVEATGFLMKGERIQGVTARDRLSDSSGLEIRARLVVNAAGPWVDRVIAKTERSRAPMFRFSKAVNLVTRPVVKSLALGITSRRNGKFLCLVPWRGVSLVGTSHGPHTGDPDGLEASELDVRDLIDDVNDAYPTAELRREDVRLIHRGLLPMAGSSRNGSVRLLKSYRIDVHLERLISVVGVKYTTARDVAAKTVDRGLALLGRPFVESRSGLVPLWGGDMPAFTDLVRSMTAPGDEETRRHLALTYGTRFRDVLAAGGLNQVCVECPVLACEIRHAVREEMACDLASVVLRRTELGTAGHPGRACLERVADIVAEELSWDEERRASEIAAVERFYKLRS